MALKKLWLNIKINYVKYLTLSLMLLAFQKFNELLISSASEGVGKMAPKLSLTGTFIFEG